MIRKQLAYWSSLTCKQFVMAIIAYLSGQFWFISKLKELFF